jgi:hypothetical protein
MDVRPVCARLPVFLSYKLLGLAVPMFAMEQAQLHPFWDTSIHLACTLSNAGVPSERPKAAEQLEWWRGWSEGYRRLRVGGLRCLLMLVVQQLPKPPCC